MSIHLLNNVARMKFATASATCCWLLAPAHWSGADGIPTRLVEHLAICAVSLLIAALIAVPVLHGWQWAALISPVFVFLLLTRVSGVPMLEKKADTKWGGQPDYEAYKKRTPVLVPLPRRAASGYAER